MSRRRKKLYAKRYQSWVGKTHSSLAQAMERALARDDRHLGKVAQFGTTTGRVASSKPNIANMPRIAGLFLDKIEEAESALKKIERLIARLER